MARIPSRQAVFIELEGMLIAPHEPRATQPTFLPRAIDALLKFDTRRFDLVVATNQPGIAMGQIRERDFKKLREEVLQRLVQEGVQIARFYYCPFHPKGKGKWRKESVFRKPNVGMFKMAQQELDLNLNRCWVAGTTSIDMLAGSRAGMGTVLVRSPGTRIDTQFDVEPHFEEADLVAATQRILRFEHALLV